MGTVRIFLAPKFDERGLPFVFREQRKLFIELDKFSTTCKFFYIPFSVRNLVIDILNAMRIIKIHFFVQHLKHDKIILHNTFIR